MQMMNIKKNSWLIFLLRLVVVAALGAAVETSQGAVNEPPPSSSVAISPDIKAIFNKPIYKNAKWGLRVVDLNTKQILLDLNSSDLFFIGSVRKIFTMGELLNEVGAKHRSITTVHRDGKVAHGILRGNLVLVASGDLTMGGRTNPDGTIAITDYDHNEADSLGNAQITKTDPLAGYKNLAKQVKKSGINKISGDVIIDDRLFDAFPFRDEFKVSPIFVNDDVVDVEIHPNKVNKKSTVAWRPHSSAFTVINNLMTVKPNMKYTLKLDPVMPQCIGQPGCQGEVKNEIPINYIPPLTNAYPLIQTFRITKPANFSRIVFIEALSKAGVDISEVKLIKENSGHLLKEKNFYNQSNQVALLQSLTTGDHAKLILKVSYNIGADTSLVLLGLAKGVRTMTDSLRIERNLLEKSYGIDKKTFNFIDGSGGGDTKATNATVTKWLEIMANSNSFNAFFAALPILSVDGSLVFVKKFQSKSSLKGAAGRVRAKTGTYLIVQDERLLLKGQSLGGYIKAKNNHLLAFQLVVNDVVIRSLDDLLDIFQDQGTVSALLWRDL